MLTIKDTYTSITRLAGGAFALVLFLGLSMSVSGQTTSKLEAVSNQPAVNKTAPSMHQPITSVYKEVKIGTAADEVRELLGKPKIDDKDGFFYDNGSEMVQIRLDADRKVRLISVTYSGKSSNVPQYSDIFSDEPATPKPDGSVYRLVRYPESGYWVAYSKTAGNEPIVTVTMQKL